jgi:hypothetical protein
VWPAPRIVRGQGSAFPGYIDATHSFAGERRAVYADACCHLKDLGSEMLADLIIRKVGAR